MSFVIACQFSSILLVNAAAVSPSAPLRCVEYPRVGSLLDKYIDKQEPERPPSPQSTREIYARDPDRLRPAIVGIPGRSSPSSAAAPSTDRADVWDTVSIRLVGSHPLWAHHLLVAFIDDSLSAGPSGDCLSLSPFPSHFAFLCIAFASSSYQC